MSTPLRWGIISTGGIATTFAEDIRLSPEGGVVVAVGSRSLESANAFGDTFNIPHRHGSYEELVANPEVDIVYVATPHPMHYANATLALEAGKHVLCEKAFTMNAQEARELVALARSKGLFLMEAMWTRFLPHIVKIREIIASGALGKIVAVEADHGKYFPNDPLSRLFAPELGGSALLDLGVYPVSFASMVLGKPSRMTCLVDPAFTGVDAYCSMLFHYEPGVHAVLTTTSSARTATRACISGTLARIELDDDFYGQVGFTVITREGQRTRYDFEAVGRGLRFQTVEIAKCIAAGKTECEIMPLDETIAIMETMDEVLTYL